MAKSKLPSQMSARQLVKAIGPTVETKIKSGIEPWMITKSQQLGYLRIVCPAKQGILPNGISQDVSDMIHERIIKQAIRDGKPVPDVVLQDYPDLVKP